MLVVCVGVVWSVGIQSLFGYEITILTGLIPPLIVVIGIPNCVYLISKYQQLYLDSKDQEFSSYDVLVNDESIDEVTVNTDLEFLKLVPSHIDLVGAEIEMISRKQREIQLKNKFDSHKEEFDYIVVDCSVRHTNFSFLYKM